eukprot:TRINITY_DN2066_c0_g1_i2.p2 TRINITY_DN2066_c0_g1~~TRINITY_DN2066_c0_g1_i2.p2  ORF type:complete len:264 (+),score=39.09 TRINITY_DN2066_c0_g1_i2:105-896(+)
MARSAAFSWFTTIFCAACIITIPFMYLYIEGLTGYYISVLMNVLIVAFDHASSDAMWKNYPILARNGFSKMQIILANLFVMTTPYFTVCLLVKYLFEGMEWKFTWTLIPAMIFHHFVSEAIFTFNHKHVMHHHFPKVHLMHHCCVNSCASINFIFNPIDFFLEFGAPLIAVLLGMAIFQDQLAGFLSLSGMSAWYFMDHDENIKTRHYFHHKFINSEYYIYGSGSFFGQHPTSKTDLVRKMIKRTTTEETQAPDLKNQISSTS